MKKQTKWLAFALCSVMLVSLLIPSVSAGTSAYDAAGDGDLLCQVDFRSPDSKYQWTVAECFWGDRNSIQSSQDGKSLDVVAGNTLVTGTVDGLTVSGKEVYTVEYDVVRKSNVEQAVFVCKDPTAAQKGGWSGFYGNAGYVRYYQSYPKNKGRLYHYQDLPLEPQTELQSDGRVLQHMKIVLDTKAKKQFFYVKLDPSKTVFAEAGTEDAWGLAYEVGMPEIEQGALALTFKTFLPKDSADELVTYSNVNIYKGYQGSLFRKFAYRDGTVNETRWVERNRQYILPDLKKAGSLYTGFLVNGSQTPTPAGTAVKTNSLNSLEAVSEQVMESTFVQFCDNKNGTQDMRVVSVLDSLDYQEIGYRVVIRYTENGEEKSMVTDKLALHTVYGSLTAKYGAETVTAKSLGYGEDCYLTAFVIKNLPVNMGIIKVEVTPYQLALGASEPEFSQTPTVITLNNGVLA